MIVPVPVELLPADQLGRVHFVGIGGAGLSGIARIMLARGLTVSGSDAKDSRILDAARSTSIPLSVTAQAEEAALASLAAESELLERVRHISARRDALAAGLREAGWRVPDAQGNFVWLPTGAETLAAAAAFEEEGLIVRPFAGEGMRISVGEEESVEKVLRIAASVVQTLPEAHAGRALA